MEQFSPVKRSKDGQPVRYLMWDDSCRAARIWPRMIETFAGRWRPSRGRADCDQRV